MEESCEVSTSTGETSTAIAELQSTSSTLISSSTSPSPHVKVKALQQQQQPHHQFRTPQQFVKHRKSSNSSLNKKNKTWNKRQNKVVKQQQLQIHPATAFSSTSTSVLTGGFNASLPGETVGIAKADLENIQNVKAPIGVGGVSYQQAQHHSQHHHFSHHSHGSHSQYIGAGQRCTLTGTLTTTCGPECRSTASASLPAGNLSVALHPSAPLEKVCYSHGHHHLNKQMYKKIAAHRGHYHNHVLCAGAAHNSHCSGSASTGACCLLHNCPTQNGSKDKDSSSSHTSASSSTVGGNTGSSLHYCCGRAKFFLPDKRLRKEIIVPPTKFLLGGNISDPLNLNSLQNDSTSSNNTPATTPRRSPITTPPKVEVIIPPNIHDPLHLLDPVDSMEYEKQLTSPLKRHLRGPILLNKPFKPGRNRKNRKRRRHDSYGSTVSSVDGTVLHDASGAQVPTETLSTSTEAASNVYIDKIASPDKEERKAGKVQEERNNTAVESECEKLSNIQLYESQVLEAGTEGQTFSANSSTCDYTGPVTRERSSRDLRLDLNSMSATNSTCSSLAGMSTLSNISVHKVSFGRGRKRKSSESNNSLKNKKLRDSLDKIVSPVVPQPGAWKRPPRQAASGARKTTRRSTSVSESELLSPAEESGKPWPVDTNSRNNELSEIHKYDNATEVGPGSPQSTVSGSTSVATTEHELSRDNSANVCATELLNKSESDYLIENAEVLTAVETFKSTSATVVYSEAPTTSKVIEENLPKFRVDGQKYRYGNYDRYKGVRQLNEFIDVRLHIFSRNAELFENKDLLDIGCNTGQMTISVARDLAPKSILGIDIDKEMIKRARRNLSMFVRIPPEIGVSKKEHDTASVKKEQHIVEKQLTTALHTKDVTGSLPSQISAVKNSHKNRKSKKQRLAAAARAAARQPATAAHLVHHHHLLHHHHHHGFHHLNNNWHPNHPNNRRTHVYANELFPISFPLSFGSLDKFSVQTPTATSLPNDSKSPASRNTPAHLGKATEYPSNEFPKNVFFKQLNYVLKDESQLSVDAQQYDLILCLSVTKWIHLNFGDVGLKTVFKRIFNQLRPGGKLILEAQNWASYKKKSNLTADIHKNYQTIEFFPNKFHEYLLSSDVGFSHSYTLGVPRHLNKGFGRPIQLYAKGDYTPNHVRWSDAYYPNTPFEEYRGIYAFMPPRSNAYAWSYAKSSTRSQPYETPHHVSGGTSGPYSCRQTPVYHPTYNPLETDSYQPSYDMESPLYQTVWSPPASLRNSSSHTPVYGSVREVELDGEGCGQYRRHVYPPNDDTFSPNANAGGAFNSIRDPDTDDSAGNTVVQHVYATHCGESSSSPQVLRPESEITDDTIISDEDVSIANITSTNFANEQ